MSQFLILSGFIFCILIRLLRYLFEILLFLPNYWSKLYLDDMLYWLGVQFLSGVLRLIPYLVESILIISWIVLQKYLFIKFFDINPSIFSVIFSINFPYLLLYFLGLFNIFMFASERKTEFNMLSDNFIVANLIGDDFKIFLFQIVFFTFSCLIGYFISNI